MPTMKEIAARCGCSVATVSKALNGMPDIGPETAERIQAVAQEMGYVLNATARTLRTRKSNVIGLLLFLHNESVWEHEYFSRIAGGIQSVVEPAGYDITPITCRPGMLSEKYMNYCRYRNYDGVIVMSAGFCERGMTELVDSGIPLVTIDCSFSGRSAVISDNRKGMQELMDYVLEKGHRRIAFIHGEDTAVTEARKAVFISACQEAGVDVPAEYIAQARYRDTEGCARETQRLLALPKRPTCILYPDDYALFGGFNVLKQAGLRVPEDMSIAGYDGIPLSRIFQPNLTTVFQDGAKIGSEVGRLILEAIDLGGGAQAKHVVVPSRLVAGQTVAACP